MKIVLAYITSILSGIVASVALLLFFLFPNWYALIAVMVFWLLFIFLLSYQSAIKTSTILLQISSAFTLFGLLSILDNVILKLLLIAFGGIMFGAIWWWDVMVSKSSIHFLQKPWRRLVVMLWAGNVYAFSTTLAGIHTFTPEVSLVLLSGLESVFSGFAAYMIWSLYETQTVRGIVWALIIGLVIAEITGVIHFLPFGYFVIGLLITWFWYIAELLTRYHLSRSGIVWRQQFWFLVGNAVAVSLLLYIVRWI